MSFQLPFVDYTLLDPGLISNHIKTESDVALFKKTSAYRNFIIFLNRLAESVSRVPLDFDTQTFAPIDRIVTLLDTLDKWIDDIPPLNTPQRFGNMAFRDWGQRLDEQAPSLLRDLLEPSLHSAMPFLRPYLLISFGSFIRLDYGTGHEASFGLFLLCLCLIRHFEPETEQEAAVVLRVFHRYLQLIYRLQDTYQLEPAGSHGVWGLDDYSFLPYIFGSSQLIHTDTTPAVALALMTPHASTSQKSAFEVLQPNFYTLSLRRILQIKRGPFHDHSPQLYSIATGVPKWEKVYSGLSKMYDAEVLGKRVVVQHIPLGGILQWDP